MGVTPVDDLRRGLADANAQEADRIQALVFGAVLSPGLVEQCGGYTAAVTQPLTGSDLDAWPRDGIGAQAVVTALNLHPAFSEGFDPPFAEVVFGAQRRDPAEFDIRREVADFIVVGLSALTFEDLLDEERARALVRVGPGRISSAVWSATWSWVAPGGVWISTSMASSPTASSTLRNSTIWPARRASKAQPWAWRQPAGNPAEPGRKVSAGSSQRLVARATRS